MTTETISTFPPHLLLTLQSRIIGKKNSFSSKEIKMLGLFQQGLSVSQIVQSGVEPERIVRKRFGTLCKKLQIERDLGALMSLMGSLLTRPAEVDDTAGVAQPIAQERRPEVLNLDDYPLLELFSKRECQIIDLVGRYQIGYVSPTQKADREYEKLSEGKKVSEAYEAIVGVALFENEAENLLASIYKKAKTADLKGLRQWIRENQDQLRGTFAAMAAIARGAELESSPVKPVPNNVGAVLAPIGLVTIQ